MKENSPAVYERYKADKENSFLGYNVVGLDGRKVGVLDDEGKELDRANKILTEAGKPEDSLTGWWAEAKPSAAEDKKVVDEAVIYGGQRALRLTSYVPLTMAVLYLLMILGFRATGGYKAVHIAGAGTSEKH